MDELYEAKALVIIRSHPRTSAENFILDQNCDNLFTVGRFPVLQWIYFLEANFGMYIFHTLSYSLDAKKL